MVSTINQLTQLMFADSKIAPQIADGTAGILAGMTVASYINDYFKQNAVLDAKTKLLREQYSLYQLTQKRKDLMRSMFMTDASMRARQAEAVTGNGFIASGIDANSGTAADTRRRVGNAIYTQALLKSYANL